MSRFGDGNWLVISIRSKPYQDAAEMKKKESRQWIRIIKISHIDFERVYRDYRQPYPFSERQFFV